MNFNKTIVEQIDAVAQLWPTFQVTYSDPESVSWIGTLRPLMCGYTVEIAYRLPMPVEVPNPKLHQPRVWVKDPQLKPRHHDPEGVLPHVYWDPDGSPSLCLFDPRTEEWSPAALIAETTIPWAADWLACYEGWRATGVWTGGGTHTYVN
jgi:hypothetical protein